MGMNVVYRGPQDLADVIPVFPLPGALLLPRGQMPLNIFEPRYLAMVDEALRTNRLVGMIQPDPEGGGTALVPKLYGVGCAGRITQFAETGDGRYLITLSGIARFQGRGGGADDAAVPALPGQFPAFRGRFRRPRRRGRGRPGGGAHGLAGLCRGDRPQARLERRRAGAERGARQRASMMSPFGPKEKQALLEAPDLKTRAEMLVAITEIELARGRAGDGSEPTLQ